MYRVYTITIYDIRKYTIRVYTTTALLHTVYEYTVRVQHTTTGNAHVGKLYKVRVRLRSNHLSVLCA